MSTDAAALVGYHSPYETKPVDKDEEDVPYPELLRLRGEAQKDEEVFKLIAWTTRKDYQTLIGISLPIDDPVGGDCHEGQLREEVDEPILITEKHAEKIYNWL
jgi:hypothetical protein